MNVSCEHIKCQERRKNHIQHEILNVHPIRDSKITEGNLKGADNSKDITTLKKKKKKMGEGWFSPCILTDLGKS